MGCRVRIYTAFHAAGSLDTARTKHRKKTDLSYGRLGARAGDFVSGRRHLVVFEDIKVELSLPTAETIDDTMLSLAFEGVSNGSTFSA